MKAVGTSAAMGVLLVAVLAVPSQAAACGGFAPANLKEPALQTGVRVMMIRNANEPNALEVHVGLSYDGPSESFAWIMPVPGDPKLSTSTDLVFFTLDSGLHTLYRAMLDGAEGPEFTCKEEYYGALCPGSAGLWPADLVKGGSGGSEATAVESSVGPFETAVITAKTGADVSKWLKDNGYQVPTSAGPILDSYAARGDRFVAAKLKKGKGAGDIVPLVLRFADARNCLPMRIAAISAEGAVPVVVWAVGPGRAFPKNALSIDIDPWVVNWLDPYANYSRAISDAVSQAGGAAWVTEGVEEAGDAFGPVGAQLWYTMARLEDVLGGAAAEVTAYDVLASALNQVPRTPQIRAIYDDFGLKPATAAAISDAKYYNCVARCGSHWGCGKHGCKEIAELAKAVKLDAKALKKRFEAVLLPLFDLHLRFNGKLRKDPDGTPPTEAMKKALLPADHVITRLSTRISAQQMDRDTEFHYRADLVKHRQYRFGADDWYWRPSYAPICDKSGALTGAFNEHSTVANLPTEPAKCASKWGVARVFVDPTQPAAKGPKSPLAWLEVVDEAGAPLRIHPGDADKVGAALAGAEHCKPSLSEELKAGLKAVEQDSKYAGMAPFKGCEADNEGADTQGADTQGAEPQGDDTQGGNKSDKPGSGGGDDDGGCSVGDAGSGGPRSAPWSMLVLVLVAGCALTRQRRGHP